MCQTTNVSGVSSRSARTRIREFAGLRMPNWVAKKEIKPVSLQPPTKFTAALPKAQRKGRIFVDYLRNQRGATAVMPYSARAREGAPVAAPITWKEMETIEGPARFHVGDQAELLKRAGLKALSSWGRADQALPDL